MGIVGSTLGISTGSIDALIIVIKLFFKRLTNWPLQGGLVKGERHRRDGFANVALPTSARGISSPWSVGSHRDRD
jgi:hypothetical protein